MNLKLDHGLTFEASNLKSSMNSLGDKIDLKSNTSLRDYHENLVDLSRAELYSDNQNYLNISVNNKRHFVMNLRESVYDQYNLTKRQTPRHEI